MPSRAKGHRVFFYGDVQGVGAGAYRVPCGAEQIVQIGHDGPIELIDVPCGGTVSMQESAVTKSAPRRRVSRGNGL